MVPTSVILTTSSTLSDLQTTSTASTTSESLPVLVGQAKTATIQAFAIQKVQDQLEASGGLNTSGTAILPVIAASGTAPIEDQPVVTSSTEIPKPAETSKP